MWIRADTRIAGEYHPRMLQAIVFDFDGVIADTEPLHHRAFSEVLEGIIEVPAWEQYLSEYLGLNDMTFLRRLFRESEKSVSEETLLAILKRKDEAYRRDINLGLPLLPGVASFVGWAVKQYPLAICSGARRVEIETILRHAGLLAAFECIVSADEVPVSKPDPAGFCRAMELLTTKHRGLTPVTCLAIEDSAQGIIAAKGAGMHVLQVCPHPIGNPTLSADCQVKDLTEVDASLLAEIMA